MADKENDDGIIMNLQQHIQSVMKTFGLTDRPIYSLTIKVRPGNLTMLTIEAEVKQFEIETAWETYELLPEGKAAAMQDTIEGLRKERNRLRKQLSRRRDAENAKDSSE